MYIFFDLDGTLTDPKYGITQSIQYALKTLERPVPAVEDLLWCIGPPLRQSFVKILETTDEMLLTRAITLYRERYSDVGKFENTVYDGISELLTNIRSLGSVIYLATSKPRVYAQDILAYFALSSHFTRVFGSELDGKFCEKPDLIEHILTSQALHPKDCLMIGDREHDIFGAKANEVASIGVTYGYGDREELTEAGADYIVNTPDEIYRILLTM